MDTVGYLTYATNGANMLLHGSRRRLIPVTNKATRRLGRGSASLVEDREATTFVRSLACSQVGLALAWDDWEHTYWVLLPGVRLEHVGVANSSAQRENRRSEFVPCAVLGTRKDVETLEVRGRTYERAWSARR